AGAERRLFRRLDGFPQGVILAGTRRPLCPLAPPAGGRIGLRRSATRAPAGRLYASGPGPLCGGRVRLSSPPGVGRQCDKLRRVGGARPPGTLTRLHRAVLQVLPPEPDRQHPVQPPLHHHLATTLPRVHRLEQLVEAVAEADRVVVGHHPLLLVRQDRRQVVARPQRPVRVTGLPRRLREAAVVRRPQPPPPPLRRRAARPRGPPPLLHPPIPPRSPPAPPPPPH